MPVHAYQNYFKKLIYSASNEDEYSELRALRLKSSDKVLCITGSGSRSLDLIAGSKARITSIDLNPAQTALLALKVKSYQSLSYEDFLGFLGVTKLSPSQRQRIWQGMAPSLSPENRGYWQKNLGAIKKGVIYQGMWERNLRILRWTFMLRKNRLNKLFNAKTLSEQKEYWQKNWDTFFWRLAIKCASQRWFWEHVAREPGVKLLDKSYDLAAYLYDSFEHMSKHTKLSDTHYAYLLFRAAYSPKVLPLHLSPKGFRRIKKRLRNEADCLQFLTEDLAGHLNKPKFAGYYNAFSLSDFSSYTHKKDYQRIWQAVAKGAAPKARVCERQLFLKYQPDTLMGINLRRNIALETELHRRDKSIFYTFVCGELN